MRIQVQLRIVGDDSSVISEGEILHLDKGDDQLEWSAWRSTKPRRYWPASREAWSPPRRQVF
jgi:hypothetical protein